MDTIIYKCPKGTQDYDNGSQALRQNLIDDCIKQFKLVGAKQIDTPAFEREDVLMEKYNDDNQKEIFRLVSEKDTEESESLALRYDLTVPLSRYVKMNSIQKMRRFQVGKVWRRDQPNMKAGRFREFTQVDYDYLDGQCDINLADAETLSLLIDTLDTIVGTNYLVRLNDRNILYNLLEYCGVPTNLYTSICSTIDKLDKKKWKSLIPELLQKGLNQDVIDKLNVELTTWKNVTCDNIQDVQFISRDVSTRIIKIFEYLQLLLNSTTDKLCKIKLDFTLARGLDYYTGIIFEVMLTGKKNNIGSIAGGGRYDNLCEIPCVGFSLGIDRILASRQPLSKRTFNPTVWVVQIDTDNIPDPSVYTYRIKILSELRNRGINSGSEMRLETGLGQQIKYILKNQIPYTVFVGSTEMINERVTLKDMDSKIQYDNITIDKAIWYICGQ